MKTLLVSFLLVWAQQTLICTIMAADQPTPDKAPTDGAQTDDTVANPRAADEASPHARRHGLGLSV